MKPALLAALVLVFASAAYYFGPLLLALFAFRNAGL